MIKAHNMGFGRSAFQWFSVKRKIIGPGLEADPIVGRRKGTGHQAREMNLASRVSTLIRSPVSR